MSTFKAYLITPPAGPREYDTVRDRAKARARELDGTSEEVELPATKGGLIPFLNALEAAHAAQGPAEVDDVTIEFERPPAPVALPAPQPLPITGAMSAPAALNAGSVTAWIMDSASQGDIERTFEALGVRFGEAIRPGRDS